MIYLAIGIPDLHFIMHGQSEVETAIDILFDERYNMHFVMVYSGGQKKQSRRVGGLPKPGMSGAAGRRKVTNPEFLKVALHRTTRGHTLGTNLWSVT